MLHTVASVIAWIFVLAIFVGEVAALVWVVRRILARSSGRPWRRTALLSGFAMALVLLWGASRVVP